MTNRVLEIMERDARRLNAEKQMYRIQATRAFNRGFYIGLVIGGLVVTVAISGLLF